MAYAGQVTAKMPPTGSVRHVRLFKNGRSQAVRIPREFELPGNEALLRQDTRGRLILEPLPRPKLLDLLSAWKPLGRKDQLPAIDDRPAEPLDI
jgi:antitoxin VapB